MKVYITAEGASMTPVIVTTYLAHDLVRVTTPHAARDERGKPRWHCLFCEQTHRTRGQFPRKCEPGKERGSD